MKRWLAWMTLLATAGTGLRADTILHTNPQGRRVVIHRDTIVIKEDSFSLLYKHFELKERRVVKVRLSQGSVPYSVVRSSPEERQAIVNKWKRFAYTATVTDLSGKTIRFFAAYLDFYPPEGRGSLLESVPPRTTFPILFEGGGADEVEFSKIARVELGGERITLTLRTGETVAGRFLPPTDQPVEARLLGMTDHYDPASAEVFDYSIPLDKIKEFRFE